MGLGEDKVAALRQPLDSVTTTRTRSWLVLLSKGGMSKRESRILIGKALVVHASATENLSQFRWGE